MSVPRWYTLAGPAYLAALLAVDTQVGLHGQLVLGGSTWLLLLAALRPLPALARAQALAVVAFATVGEVTGSLVWGVYRYRLHNLPLFIPPAHGLVYLSGLALVRVVRTRWLVAAAAAGSIGWALAGLTVLPRLDVAGAFGVPLLCLFLWRSRSRAVYAAGRLKPKLASRSSGVFRNSSRRIEPSGTISASGASSSSSVRT